jgi:hypothetical protein
VIALMTMFRGGVEGTFELRLDGHVFALSAHGGRLDGTRGPATDPVAVIEGGPGTLASVLWHGADPRQLTVSGDARRFLGAFTRTVSSTSWSHGATPRSSSSWIRAPGVASRIGECVAITNRAPAAAARTRIATSARKRLAVRMPVQRDAADIASAIVDSVRCRRPGA